MTNPQDILQVTLFTKHQAGFRAKDATKVYFCKTEAFQYTERCIICVIYAVIDSYFRALSESNGSEPDLSVFG